MAKEYLEQIREQQKTIELIPENILALKERFELICSKNGIEEGELKRNLIANIKRKHGIDLT